MQEEPKITQSTPTSMVPEWFNGSSTPTITQPEPKKPHKKRLLIAGVILIVALLTGGLLYAVVGSVASTCLDSSDYEALTGVRLDYNTAAILTPGSPFFIDYVSFKIGSAEFDNPDDAEIHGFAYLQNIAKFYTARQIKPMLITVSADYVNASSLELASQRIANVQSSLIKAGVPEKIVMTTSPKQLTSDEETSIDSSDDDIKTTISITADTACK